MSGLLQRATTGFFFIAIITLCIYLGPTTFVLLFTVITWLCLREFLGLVLSRTHRRDIIRRILGVGMGMVPFFLATILQLQLVSNRSSFIAIAAILFFPFIFSSFIYELYTKSNRPFSNVAFIVLAMIYIGVPFGLLTFVAFDEGQYYPNLVFALLAMNWMNDSGAYLVGSRIGKTPLFPSISPKKTWEGSLGGMATTLILSLGICFWIGELRLADWVVLSVIVVVFGSLGDLVESMLKRSVKIKDSGTLLPGHGGMLDRFDAFIFMLPFATAYILWIR
ncbi:MAG: phosphatidate cytidylyltransferase [Bacteroidetes bacterium]|jgi:phosphatidate cytidylyltransferase|nr:phosphatidate cytidylyltransferase [Bacteroidota bacterium]